jgi:hypothetical protein
MPKVDVYQHAFATGVVDKDILPRVDLERMRLAAEDQTNLLCTTAGNMFLRPGLQYLSNTRGNGVASLKDFSISASSAALLELTDSKMRVFVADELVVRNDVATTVNNGDFGAAGTWSLTSTSGASCTISGNRLRMQASATGSKATAKQEVNVAVADRGVEHGLFIEVARGPVTFRCGSSNGGDQYIEEAELKEGVHSLAFTPTGTSFWLFFQTSSETNKLVKTCQIEAAGNMVLDTPWSASQIDQLREGQSADVMFVASGGQQYRIERRGNHSWSIVKYLVDDGPFQSVRSALVRLKPGALRGNTTLTASDNFFLQDHVGAIFYLFHNSQNVLQTIAGDELYTDPIKVTGVYDDVNSKSDRTWHYTVSGTWIGTLQVFKSSDSEDFGYQLYRKQRDVSDTDITANVSDQEQADRFDNAIFYYRIGFADGNYTSGAAQIDVSYGGGGDYGICRVTDFTDKTTVSIEILRPFKNTTFTSDWKEGMWSDAQDWPTAVGLAEGRLDWAGRDKVWDSVSDAYESFDEKLEGDAGPISRSIAIGSVNEVQWVLPLQRTVYGTNGGIVVAKSSSLDEPLSPTSFTLKSASSVGCGPIAAIKIDGRGVYADGPLKALFEIVFSSEAGDYATAELTRLCASWFNSGIVKLAAARRPDTRIWAVLGDGTCMCMIYEPEQQVIGFVPIVTDGLFESVAVLPGQIQDNVYFVVKRTIEGVDKRYVEKMARDNQAAPITQSRIADSYIIGTNSPPAAATILGLSHLIGEQVKVWADGAPVNEVVDGLTVPKLFTVVSMGTAGGGIVLDRTVTNYCVGLPYSGRYKSARLAYGGLKGTAMIKRKKVSNMGLILSDFVASGVRYGVSKKHSEVLRPLPEFNQLEQVDDVNNDEIVEYEDLPIIGDWWTDSRILLTADWSCSFLGLGFAVETND